MERTALARQPILDSQQQLHAYELLFRPSPSDTTSGADSVNQPFDGTQATAKMIVNTFADSNLPDITENKLAFVNFNREFLINKYFTVVPPEGLVIEILEDVEIDQNLIDIVASAHAEGYQFALDDYEFSPEAEALLPYMTYVKVDVLMSSEECVKQTLQQVADYQVKLIAEKIEDQKMLQQCIDSGFDYFQGYFLCRPNIIEGRTFPSNKVALMSLIAKLNNPEITVSEVGSLLSQDPVFSYKLLCLVNSAAMYTGRKIQSLREVIVRLGLKNIRNMASVIALSNLAAKPPPLMDITLIRAKMCEEIAERLQVEDADTFFIMGLFSTLDAFFDLELNEILERLPLDKTINEALISRVGDKGELLNAIIHYEQGNWEDFKYSSLSFDDFNEIYLDSVKWAKIVKSALSVD